MARRARDQRQAIPGYLDRPSRKERRREHRRVRHAAHQLLTTIADPEEIEEAFPEVRSQNYSEDFVAETELSRQRFRVWKTKFWKRRDGYRDMRAELDSRWTAISEPEEDW